MIKDIFFDIGNVLVDIYPEQCIQYWTDSTDLKKEEVMKAFSTDLHNNYETGKISNDDFFYGFKNALPQPCCLKKSDFWRGWEKILGKEKRTVKILETLSKGYKRRVGLSQAILHDPDILILDEPTDGLDPNQKHEVRKLIKEMASTKAIIISTHILEEVDAVCTRAMIIAKGRMIIDKSPKELLVGSPKGSTLDDVFRDLTIGRYGEQK